MTLPRVVFLSAPPLGEVMLEWLKSQPCEIYFSNVADDACWPIGEYDLGLNFLATRRVLPEQIFRPRLGWANWHPAPLPEFGGRNVAYHAITTYAEEFGATVHYMDEGFDTGPIIECRRFSITDEMTAGDLMTTAKGLLVKMFQDWVPKLLQGRVPATPQENTRYYKQQKINDFVKVTDVDVLDQIRALTAHPKHHARLMIGGRRYKIVPEDCK